jgi:hypothetical protein
MGTYDIADAVRGKHNSRPRHSLCIATQIRCWHLQSDNERRYETTTDIVANQNSNFVGFAVQLPHQCHSNDCGNQVGHHDIGSAVGEFRCQVSASKDPKDLEGALGNAKRCGLEGILDEALDDELSKVRDASVDNLVEKHEQRQKPDLRVQQSLPDLVKLDVAVQNSSPTQLGPANQSGLLFDSKAFGSQYAVWQKGEHYQAPKHRDPATEDEDGFPDRE